ncbi:MULTISPECIES: hypothetical protein [Pseudoalteromonas]|uniref:Uncharacterized protein n=1 Tax=Pseudoalteromonas rubra TaxID=43658 RepID=A0A5S3UU62_9GAMM|nr:MULTISPECIES: hypothetical protein [Pseudoalteromonas]MCG7560843.1 hypothetical protein [Pseudoalteromonas sp. McH1-42]MEC4089951.1 hypothetical protein [Pseudoalteromonas rubra]QPB82904.1 hypothetical protein CWC22_007845 [Pseudoalteromonas rubra]
MKLKVKKTQLKRLSDKHAGLAKNATPQVAGGQQAASISAGVLCVVTSLVNCSQECSKLLCSQDHCKL